VTNQRKVALKANSGSSERMGIFIGKARSDGADYRLPGEVRRPPRHCTRWLLQSERGVPASENRRRTRQDGLPQQIDRRQGKPSCFIGK
jgi:hypothetical protein